MRELREIIDRTAAQLREELNAAFKLGDEHLKGHIDQQFAQVEVALQGAEKRIELAFTAAEGLEVERVRNAEKRVNEALTHLTDRVDNGDQQLREHVIAQVGQIQAALDALRRETALAHHAADDLEVTRVNELRAAMDQKVARVQAELLLMHNASEKAIQKAEQASEKRFEAVNEFRQTLTDQAQRFMLREVADAQFHDLRKRIDEGSHLAGLMLPRETWQSTVDEWTTWRDTVNKALVQAATRGTVEERQQDRIQPWAIWAGGAVLTFILSMVVVLVNVVTSSP